MNLFRILKNKSGKFTLGVQQLAVVGVGAAALFYASNKMFASEEAHINQLKARSISSLAASEDTYSGLRQTGAGLTSINITNAAGFDGVANFEERQALEAQSSGGSDFGAGADENFSVNPFSDGLGMGANEATFAPGGVSGADDYYGGSDGGYDGGSARGAAGRGGKALARGSVRGANGGRGSGGRGGSLGTAQMARASGGGTSNSFGGGTGGSSATKAGGSEGYKLSGAMPTGGNPVLDGASGRGGSKFNRGSRNGSAAKAGSFGGSDLKDMAVKSAKIAATDTRAANLGSSIFLANSQLSGGMSFSNGEDGTRTGSSSDFAKADATTFKKLSGWKKNTDDENDQRLKWAKGLKTAMTVLLSATMIMIPLIANAARAGDIPIWGQIAGNAVALGLCIALSAMWGIFSALVGVYWGKFSKGEWSWFSFTMLGIAGLCTAAGWIAFATQNESGSSEAESTSSSAVEGEQGAQEALSELAGKGGEAAGEAAGKGIGQKMGKIVGDAALQSVDPLANLAADTAQNADMADENGGNSNS